MKMVAAQQEFTRQPTEVDVQEDRGGHDMRNHNANLREDTGMRKSLVFGLAVVSVWLLGGLLVSAQETHDKAHAELAKALKGAKVSLAKGLTASVREGTPISGKFELEEGKLQLSVYTMKGDAFSEVIVDHTTGKVAKVEVITSGGDFTAATAQRAAMTNATKSLQTVVDTAVKAHPGTHAVSVFPALKGEHAAAEITLAKGGVFTTVSASLE
jgi:hypothetical protein